MAESLKMDERARFLRLWVAVLKWVVVAELVFGVVVWLATR